MPLTFNEKSTMVDQPAFTSQVKIAMLQAATTVAAEATDVPLHVQRRAFALSVLRAPLNFITPFALMVAAYPGITSTTPPDNDVLFTVNTLWNAMAVSDDSVQP